MRLLLYCPNTRLLFHLSCVNFSDLVRRKPSSKRKKRYLESADPGRVERANAAPTLTTVRNFPCSSPGSYLFELFGPTVTAGSGWEITSQSIDAHVSKPTSMLHPHLRPCSSPQTMQRPTRMVLAPRTPLRTHRLRGRQCPLYLHPPSHSLFREHRVG